MPYITVESGALSDEQKGMEPMSLPWWRNL